MSTATTQIVVSRGTIALDFEDIDGEVVDWWETDQGDVVLSFGPPERVEMTETQDDEQPPYRTSGWQPTEKGENS